jgi:hypothetical protein
MANEPSVKVSIIDDTLNLGSDPVNTDVNVLVPVISPSGRAGCYKVSGSSEFKREYNNSNKVIPTDHISMITARALSSHTPIWVKRVIRNNILAGRDSLNSRNVYVDRDTLLPISGNIVKLSIPNKKNVADSVSNFQARIQSIASGGTITVSSYSISNSEIITSIDPSTSASDIKGAYELLGTAVEPYTKTPTNVLKMIRSSDVDGIQVTFNSSYTYIFSNDKDSDLSGLLEYIQSKNIYPDHVNGQNIYYDIETHKVVVLNDASNGIDELVFNNSNVTIKVIPTKDASGESYKTTIRLLDNSELSKYLEYCYLKKSEEDFSKSYPITNIDISFTLNNTIEHRFVKGEYEDHKHDKDEEITEILHKITADTETAILKYIYDTLYSICEACTISSMSFVVPGLTSADKGDKSEIVIETQEINTTINLASYAIVSLTPNTYDNINITVTQPDKTIPDMCHLTMTYGSISEDYDFSMTDGAVDGYGTDISYTKINDKSNYIRIVKLDGKNYDKSYSFNIGSGISNDYIDEDSIGDALQSIIDEEANPVLFDYVSDGGVIGNSNITSAIKNCISEWHSFYIASCPTKMTKTNLESMVTSLGDTYTICMPGYSAKTTDIDQGSVLMSGSYFYLVRRLEMANSNLEYTSIFGDRGLLSITPFVKFKKVDREELLDYRIPTLQPRLSSSGSVSYYQNLDCTLQSTTSYLQDVNIVLMTNKICQLAINYGKTLIGHNNTRILRLNVETELGTIIQDRLRVGTEYGPLGVSVLCNSVTTQSLIDRGYVKIEIYASFTRAIQNVLVYTHVQSLSDNSNS